jgi:hypothetical protein
MNTPGDGGQLGFCAGWVGGSFTMESGSKPARSADRAGKSRGIFLSLAEHFCRCGGY